MRIGISGVCGKMGKRIAALAASDPEITITAALEKAGTEQIGKSLGDIIEGKGLDIIVSSELEDFCGSIDCLIEFTLPTPTLEHLDICKKNGIPIVIGTTGLGKEGEERIKTASGVIPVVFSPNMAVGVNLLFNIVREAACVLKDDFDIKVDETHHVHKKDTPSGTAKMIARVISDAAGITVPIDSFREGEIIGNHGVIFDNKYEKLEIRHDAKSRDVFASGAIKAAKFVFDKKPGLYSMQDVLGLN